jgi:hypothetical protein
MINYKMQVQTSTGGVCWEYNFEMASNAMAAEYAMRHTKQFAGVNWFMSLLLWRRDEFDTEDWRVVGEYGLNEVTAKEIKRERA